MKSYTERVMYNFSNVKKNIVFDGILVGIFAGLVSVSYRYFLAYLETISAYMYSFKLNVSYVLFLIGILSIMGIIVGLLVKMEPLSSGSGIPQVEGELMGVFDMDENKIILSKFIGGSFAGVGGLSLGREGPSIQLGAATGKLMSKFLRRDINEQRYLISAGASAGLAAAFSAPISGTIFILEEMHKNFSPLVLVPAIIASVIADFMSKYIFGLKPAFSFSVKTPLSLNEYGHVIALGILVGLVGVAFSRSLLGLQTLYKKLPIENIYKPVIAFLFAGIMAFTYPSVLGGGHHMIEALVDNKTPITMLFIFLVLKILFTSVCYGSTTQGGIFLPTLVFGALTGVIYYTLIITFTSMISQEYLVNFIILGMAGILSSVVRSPILSIMLVTEMTGSFDHILTLSMISIVSYLVAEVLGCKPIYESLLGRLLSGHKKGEDKAPYGEKVIYQFMINYNSQLAGKSIKDIQVPPEALIVSVKRFDDEIIPKGETILRGGDILTILSEKHKLKELKEKFSNL